MSKIEKELLEATGLKARKGEERQAYLRRLADKVGELGDKEWEAVSGPAQDWTNAASKAVNKAIDIPDFPDAAADSGDEEEETPRKKPAAAKPAAKSKSKDEDEKKPADADEEEAPKKKPVAAAKKSEAKSKDGGEPKKEGIQVAIKKIMLARPKISASELTTLLEDRGYTVSQFTIATIRSDFRNSLKVIKDAGLIDIEL